MKQSWAVLALLLAGVAGSEEVTQPPVTTAPAESSATGTSEERTPAPEPERDVSTVRASARQWYSLMRLEATTWALLPRAGVGTDEGFAQIEPTLILDGGAEFGVNVGAPVRLRLWGGGEGAGVDALTPTLDMKLRLEARRQHGGFQQGYFGPDYELARFPRTGPDGVPLAAAPLPDGFSVFGEAEVGWDAVGYGGLQKHLKLSLGAEVFTWGRFDVDGRVAVQLFQRNVELTVKGLGVGMGQPGARYLGTAEVRWRVLGGKLYALGTGGTLLFPEVGGTLRPGAFASVGLGVDGAR